MPDRLIKVAFMWGDSLLIAALAFFGASFAGLASQLRSGKALTRRAVASAMLNLSLIHIFRKIEPVARNAHATETKAWKQS